MLKNTRTRIIRVIFLFLVVIVGVFIALLLFSWTRSIQEDKQLKELSKVLHTIAEEQGPQGVLALSGLQVSDILYGEDGLILLEDDQSSSFYTAAEQQNINVYDKVNRSVVHISTVLESQVSSFMDVVPQQGTGSGIVLSKDGYILTNAHVVGKATSLNVGLYNNQTYSASIVGLDSEDDLAVIKLNSVKDVVLYPAVLGTSEDLKIGQRMIAIGNPFGYDRTMSTGVVSGLNRPVRTSEGTVVMNAIQTDAAIHPGNSGGPLLNTRGEVVGINSAIFTTSSGSSQGLNFAIPVDTAIAVIPDLIKLGKVSRGWLDLACVQLTPQLISYANLSVDKGVLVSEVVKGGFSDKAGIKAGSQKVQYGSSIINLGGDIITAIDGQAITDLNDLYLALLPKKSGDKVSVTVNRKGETITMNVELIERTAQHVSALVR